MRSSHPHTMTAHTDTALPTFADVESAAAQIAGVAHRTPVVTSRTVDARTGAHAVLQVREPAARRRLQVPRRLQRALAARSPTQRRRGVVDVLVGQPRAGGRARRTGARHPARHRHAVRRAGGEAHRDAKATAARSSSTIATARTAKRSASRLAAERGLTRRSRPTITRTSSPARERPRAN